MAHTFRPLKPLLIASLALVLTACAGPAPIGTDPALTATERDAIQASAPRPDIAPADQLRATTVTYTVEAPLAFMVEWHGSVPLQDLLERSGEIPNVVGTELLVGQAWAGAGVRRRVLLEGGDTALEDLLADDLPRSFHYIAWNYTADAARFVEYGVGEFSMRAIDSNTTEVTWTYAFKPRGILGRVFVGRWVNSTWRTWMEDVAKRSTDQAEADYRASQVSG
jgi:hypothetical protein